MVDAFAPTHFVKSEQILAHSLLQHEQQFAVIIKVLGLIVIALPTTSPAPQSADLYCHTPISQQPYLHQDRSTL